MISLWLPLANMFKLIDLMCSCKALMSNSLLSWYVLLLENLALYIFLTVSCYWMILSALLGTKMSAVRKVVLDDLLCGKGILMM